MAFHDAPGPDRVMFCSVGYARGPETRVYMDGSDAGLSRGEVVAALNGWVVDKDTIAELRARIAALESQLAESADRLRHAEAEIDRLIDENQDLREDLVWAVRREAHLAGDDAAYLMHYTAPGVGCELVGREINGDGTDADILRAVREARGSL